MDATEPLARKLSVTGEALVTSLGNPDFYFESLFIGISVAIAWLLSILIQRRAAAHFAKHPPQKIDAEFILKPLSLSSPVLAILYLGVAKPFAQEYGGGMLTDAAIQLSLAYLVAKCVLLIVRFRPIAYFIAGVVLISTLLDVTGFMKSVTASLSTTNFEAGSFKISMLDLTHGIIILVIVFWIAGVLSRTLESYLRRSSSLSYSARELTVKFFRVFVYFTALLITLSSMGVDLTAFAVFGGALGVGIGLGLQKITSNFISGIMLLIEKSIKLGDLIEVGTVTGWVRQLNIRYTLLETADGRELLIPNEELVSTRLTNWTYSNDRARIEIKVNVAYDSDARLAQRLMLEAAREHPLCLKNPEPNCWLREFGDSGISFMLTFWISNVHDGRFGPQSDVMFAIVDKFRKAGITIPYPQRVMHTPKTPEPA